MLSAVAVAVLLVAFMVPFLMKGFAGKSRYNGVVDTLAPGSQEAMSLPPTDAATTNADMEKAGGDPLAVASASGLRLDAVRDRLTEAGLSGEPFVGTADGKEILAVWLKDGEDLAVAREILGNLVTESLVPCETLPDIEIMEGKTPIRSADSPENRQIQEALGFLPQVEASVPVASGTWLILSWQVEN